ncbi:MAG TPA: YHS domain-containing protein [Burkholderiales bacterium]|nr:YHS domain-containing protein [Burkholderiales bacterium]
MERDPVCGMLVDTKEAAGSRDYGGKTYYFCSQNCLDRFSKNPKRYVGAPGDAPASSPPRKD